MFFLYPTTMSPVLEQLAEEAYTIFAEYNVPTFPLHVCYGHCVSEKEEELLRSTPKREIPSQLLYQYNTTAEVHLQETFYAEYKYFLPRIIQLIGLNEDLHFAEELNFSRAINIPIKCWKEKEIEFLQRFSASFFEHIRLQKCVDSGDVVSALIMTSYLPNCLSYVLDSWMPKLLHNPELLFQFIYNHLDFIKEKLDDEFSNKVIHLTIFRWLKKVKPKLMKSIESIILNDLNSFSEEEKYYLDLVYSTLEKWDDSRCKFQ